MTTTSDRGLAAKLAIPADTALLGMVTGARG